MLHTPNHLMALLSEGQAGENWEHWLETYLRDVFFFFPRLSEVIWYVIYSRTSDYTDFSSFQHSFCVRQHAYLNHTRIHKQNGQKKVQKWLKDTCPVSNTEPTLATAHRLERNGNSNNRDSENRHCTVHSSKDQKMQILCFLPYIT